MNNNQKRRAGKWVLTVIGLVFLLPLLVIVFLYVKQLRGPYPVSLPDGSTVALEGVTYGKKHVLPGDLSYLFTDNLPKWSTELIGIKPPPTLPTDRQSLGIWLKRPGLPQALRRVGGREDLRAHLVDENGFVAPAPGHDHGIRSGSGSHPPFQIKIPHNYPRKSDEIGVRIYWSNGSTNRLLQEATMKNPYPVESTPSWEANPLPMTQATNSLKVTLLEAQVGVESSKKFPTGQRQYTPAALRLQIQENESLVDHWAPKNVTVLTPGANAATVKGTSEPVTEGIRKFRFGWPLWSDESVCELRIEFAKAKEARFSSHEIATFTIEPETPNVANEPAALRERGLFVNKKIPIQAPILRNFFDVHFKLFWTKDHGFQLDMPRLFNDYDFTVTLLRVTDAEGESVPTTQFHWRREKGHGVLNLPPAKSFDRLKLKVAIHKGRSLTFRVKPEFRR